MLTVQDKFDINERQVYYADITVSFYVYEEDGNDVECTTDAIHCDLRGVNTEDGVYNVKFYITGFYKLIPSLTPPWQSPAKTTAS